MDGIIRELNRRDRLQQVVNLGQAMEIDGEQVTVTIASLELSFMRLKDRVMDEAVNGVKKPTRAEFYANKLKSGGQAGRKIEESQYIDEADESGEIKYYNGDQAYELIKSILIQDEDALRGRDIESISTDDIFEYGAFDLNIYQNPDWDRLDEQILVGRIHPDIAVQLFIPQYEHQFIDVHTKISKDGFTEIYGQRR